MNIYVGNLAYSTTEEDLRAAFEEYGKVDTASVISDHYSGRSKGFGFVEMPDKGEAEAAIEAMNGAMLGGRDLRVNEARPRQDKGDRGPRGPRRDRGDRGGDRDRW